MQDISEDEESMDESDFSGIKTRRSRNKGKNGNKN